MKHIQFSGLICVKNMRPMGQLLNEMVFPFLSALTREAKCHRRGVRRLQGALAITFHPHSLAGAEMHPLIFMPNCFPVPVQLNFSGTPNGDTDSEFRRILF